MPLRIRLIALVGVVLLASLACGSALVAWHEANSVRTELRAALEVGVQTIRNSTAGDPIRELPRLVAMFDGNRHVRATLLDANGQAAARSTLFAPTQAVPQWFRWLLGGALPAVRMPLADGAIVLQTDPTNEVGEVWAESRDAVLVLAGFAALSALLISMVVGRALRSLERLAGAFQRIGEGDYPNLLPVKGPPEITRLAHGFNAMSRRLAAIAAQNHRLNERLLTLQAEERADLARDLHDEVGPLLFAVDMTAATIERLTGSGREAEVPAHAQAIHDAVGRMQRHIRAILGRLRPLEAVGLEAAIERLAAFWRNRRPDIAISLAVSVDESRTDSLLKETIYRVVQEGMSNAIRHGTPAHIDIRVLQHDRGAVRIEVTDDGLGMPPEDTTTQPTHRLGLIGMRERVMALAGSLATGPGPGGVGLALVVRLPCTAQEAAQ
jgi:two-component system sensor histidine kinase UhpB